MCSRSLALNARASWALYTCALLAGDARAEELKLDAQIFAQESGIDSFIEKSGLPLFLRDVPALAAEWDHGWKLWSDIREYA
ncbi:MULTISPECIES: hypothetical protein [Burkholderia]|jgi:hypothetical protein|uniref:Uncharacterized protein n=1 Tax=Burkholderia contaminans TaxID=488447 RepID=A0AAP1VCF1_9BURK|nr:hypothetical protein [Burkholderia contaminans]ELK7724897.1 hypothetical protein [Burkholderia cenocepacia]UTP27889.1 hypothetical protein NMB33_40340 [Burkholderia sp. FXe9]HBN6128842.1 hypothetical protein [Clostridioides difficile]MBA9833393.1 hypothetical protein [Burkholderia contaminans]MBH9693764.1 hypothetical protein [Burkholderia contaminans]